AGGLEARIGRDGRVRTRVGARAEDEQARWRPEDVDERGMVADLEKGGAAVAFQQRPGALRQVAIELRRSRASDQGTAGQHQGLALERTANDGYRGERHAGSGELAHLLAGCIDPAGADALERQLDGP